MSKRELIAKHRGEILALATKRGAHNVRLIGSVARGDDNDQSDIDLIVSLEPGRTLLDLGGLLMDLQKLLGCKVDVATEHRDISPHFRAEVERDAVAL